MKCLGQQEEKVVILCLPAEQNNPNIPMHFAAGEASNRYEILFNFFLVWDYI